MIRTTTPPVVELDGDEDVHHGGTGTSTTAAPLSARDREVAAAAARYTLDSVAAHLADVEKMLVRFEAGEGR